MGKLSGILVLLFSTTVAYAGPKDEAQAIVWQWAKAFGDTDVDGISKLYAPDAIMIGTYGKYVLTEPADIRKYFNIALNTDKPRTAKLNSSETVVVDDNMVVIAGMDTITGVKPDGQTTEGKGRVTFVVVKRGTKWLIVHLHRSPLL